MFINMSKKFRLVMKKIPKIIIFSLCWCICTEWKFFQAIYVSVLIYVCTIWVLTKHLEKKLDGNYLRIQRAILNKYCKLHPTKQQWYWHLPPISLTVQIRQTKHAEHEAKLHGFHYMNAFVFIDLQNLTYISSADIRFRLEDLQRVMADRNGW